jgi:type II secretory pathway pseudopilin PulG
MMRRVRLRHPSCSHTTPRGIALVEVIVAGVMLAVGLAVVISLASRAIKTQTDGEKRMIAAWLADEQLSMVVVEGPVNFPKMYDTSGRCPPPFSEFDYDVTIEDLGLAQPFRVTATVRWLGVGGPEAVHVQSLISERGGDPNEPRAPLEPVDRDQRWYEKQNAQAKK